MAQLITGTVVSTKMQKTVVISVESRMRHPLYKKVIKRSRKFKAHNEVEGIVEGDTVQIQSTRPRSKEVSFEVVKKVEIK
jgi:small subunit ribosomal protein S17